MNEWLLAHGSYLLIPFIAALAGWGTNWLAIKMTFYPLVYVGIVPLRLARRGARPHRQSSPPAWWTPPLAASAAWTAIVEAIDMEEVKTHFLDCRHAHDRRGGTRPDARAAARCCGKTCQRPPRNWCSRWSRWSCARASTELRKISATNYGRLLDLKELVVTKCEEHPDLLNQLAFACLSRELSFLVFSGVFFGFAFGIVQALVWFFVPQWWELPFFGLLVGSMTNWIAIQLIFTPLEPKKVGPWVVQGLYLKR